MNKALILIFFFAFQVGSSQVHPIEKALEFLSEHYINVWQSENGANELLVDDLENSLLAFLDSPLKINLCSYSQLLDFPLFNESQLFHILNYRNRFGNFRSIAELNLLPQFSDELIDLLLPFINFSEQNEVVRKRRKIRLVGTTKYSFTNDTIIPNYVGNLVYQSVKLEIINLLPKYSFGMNVEKDKGELWHTPRTGIEHANLFINYKDETSSFKQVIAGTYKISLGQGLVVNSGYNNYRSRFVQNGTSFNKTKIRPQSSNDESISFKGAAGEFQYLNFQCVAFVSFNKFDATIYSDSTGLFFSSVGNSGMHRSEQELKKKDKVAAKDAGCSFSYLNDHFNVSWNHLYAKLSIPFKRTSNYYNDAYLLGNEFYVQSLDFNLLWKYLHFFGEIAVDKEFDVAFLSGASGSVAEVINYRVLFRNYRRDFQSFRGKSYQQTSRLRNEKGVVFQVDGRLGPGFSYHGFYDIYMFPEMSYRKRFSAVGSEQSIKILYQGDLGFRAHLKLKSKRGQKNATNGKLYKQNEESRRSVQLNYSLQVTENVRLKGQCEYLVHTDDTNSSSGVLLFQELKHTINKVTYGPRLTVFSIDNYNARIYVYEPSLMYSSPFIFFKDTGLSLSSKIKWQVDEHFSTSVKLHATFTQNNSSRELNLIAKSGINVQCSAKF